MPWSSHWLAAGVVVVESDAVLLVCERIEESTRWSLPKGSPEAGEPLRQAAEREIREETGLEVSVQSLAFVSEWMYPDSERYHPQLHVYFSGRIVGGELSKAADSGGSILEARFVPTAEVRRFLTFKPWLIPLEAWLAERTARHHFFNLDAMDPEIDSGDRDGV